MVTIEPEIVAQEILERVDVNLAVGLTQEVSRIPSVFGEEGELAKFLHSLMKELGFEQVELQPVLPDRPNALGELHFGDGPRVVLTGHMDTKPVSHGWTATTPYSAGVVGCVTFPCVRGWFGLPPDLGGDRRRDRAAFRGEERGGAPPPGASRRRCGWRGA